MKDELKDLYVMRDNLARSNRYLIELHGKSIDGTRDREIIIKMNRHLTHMNEQLNIWIDEIEMDELKALAGE